MKYILPVIGLALGGLCLVSCEKKDPTVAELTAKLLDVQNKLGAMEAMQNRMGALDSVVQRVSDLEASEKRVTSVAQMEPRLRALENLSARVTALEGLEFRVNKLEALPNRISSVEGQASRIAKLEALPERVADLDKLAERVAVLEDRLANLPTAAGQAKAKELTPMQQAMARLKEYSLVDAKADSLFLSHVARVERGDSTMKDYPVLAEMLSLGKSGNPVPLFCVKIFVEAGADVDAPDKNGVSPLMYACQQGDPEVVAYLLDKKASVVAVDKNEDTALAYLIRPGDGPKRATILQMLCAAGCDAGQFLANGSTPLCQAVECHADVELLQAFVSCGADVTATNKNGISVMDLLNADATSRSNGSRIPMRCRTYLEKQWEQAKMKEGK